MKTLIKRTAVLTLIIFSFIFAGCHMFDTWEKAEDVKIYFEDPNLTVMEGGLAYFVLKIEPEDARGNVGVEYEVINKRVGQVYNGNRKGVIVTAKEEGSCTITAWLGDAKAEAVLTVTAKTEK